MPFRARPNLDIPAVPVRNAKATIESARRVGISADSVLAGTGVCEEHLRVPAARITYRAFIQMQRNLASHPLPADYGFMKGPFSIASYGMLGYAMMSCATLGQAIQIALKYYRTAGPLFDLTFEMDDERLVVRADNVFDLGPELLTLVTEELITAFPLLLDSLVGTPVAPLRVDLGYPDPGRAALYSTTFGCPIEFDALCTRYVLGADALALPLVQADADSAVMFERSCRELLAEIERHDSLANELRQLLLSMPGKLPDAATAASRLRLGERTLRRRLAEEGTTFQAVLDEVRCHVATDYLVSTHLSMQEIAELLGFSEATNFRRAFLRWTRRTPTSYRKHRSAGSQTTHSRGI
jgi:AraC-like DNA-binding protein